MQAAIPEATYPVPLCLELIGCGKPRPARTEEKWWLWSGLGVKVAPAATTWRAHIPLIPSRLTCCNGPLTPTLSSRSAIHYMRDC